MFIVPLGIEAKTVITPWMTFAVVLVISFTTILNRSLNDQLNEIYIHSPERLAYQRELKSFLDERCKDHLRPSICEQLQKSVLPEHLMSVEVFRTFQPQKSEEDARELLAYVRPWLDEEQVPQLRDSHPRFVIVKEKLALLRARVHEFVEEHEILGTDNFSGGALLKSQFLHSGLMHLMGNLIFLLLLAFPVEQRLGGIRYLGIYFLSGFCGMALQAAIGGHSLMIVGASANVFGVAGAFLALFLRERIRILVSFFMIHHQTVLIPVIGYFGFWIVGEELLGLMRTTSDGVAHWAHVGGFAAGFLGAKLLDRFPALPKGLVYPYEVGFLRDIEDADDDETRLRILTRWLHANPASENAAFLSLEVVRRLLLVGFDSTALNQFYRKMWPDLFQRHLQQEKFLSAVPMAWLSDSKNGVNLSAVGHALSYFHREKKLWCEWLLLYHVAQAMPPLPVAWDQRMNEVTKLLYQTPEMVEKFRELSQQSSRFQKFVEKQAFWLNSNRRNHAGSS